MLESAIRDACDGRLQTALLDGSTYPNINGVPVAFENTPNKTDVIWMRVQLVIDSSENGTTGAANQSDPYIKHEGNYIISIFTKLNIGTKQSNDLVDDLTSLFENKTFSGVWTKNPSPRKLGDDSFGYYHVNLLIPFITVS